MFDGWYLQTPTEIMMSVAKPMKAQVIDQSLNEFIVMSYYLIPPVNNHQQTELFSFSNYNDKLWLPNQLESRLVKCRDQSYQPLLSSQHLLRSLTKIQKFIYLIRDISQFKIAKC